MEFCHLELGLSGCNKEVAALHSDHYIQVRLYCALRIKFTVNFSKGYVCVKT